MKSSLLHGLFSFLILLLIIARFLDQNVPYLLAFIRYIDLSILLSSPAAGGKETGGKKRPGESVKETDPETETDVRPTKNKKRKNKRVTRKKDVREEETHSDDS